MNAARTVTFPSSMMMRTATTMTATTTVVKGATSTARMMKMGRRLFTSSTSVAEPPKKVLITGAGIIGLRTAVELRRQAKNVQVVVRAPSHPVLSDSCSKGAGGYWMPFHCEDPRIDEWALETYQEYQEYHKKNQNTTATSSSQPPPSVEKIPALLFWQTKQQSTSLPSWTKSAALEFQELSMEMLAWQNTVLQMKIPPPLTELQAAGYYFAWMFQSYVVDTPAMLTSLLQELEQQQDTGVDINVETGIHYESLEHLQETARELDCDTIVNCTGLGARSLVPDPQVIPARGALHIYDRATCVRRPEVLENGRDASTNHQDVVMSVLGDSAWSTESHPAYFIPRGSRIVVGGTYLEGDEEPKVRATEHEQLRQTANRFGIDTTQSDIAGDWVGLRPFRSPVRFEYDPQYPKHGSKTTTTTDASHIPIFHSYGYGGSGWTVDVGAAKACVHEILSTDP